MKEKTYCIKEAFGADEVEVIFEGGEDFEWDRDEGVYLFSCLVSKAEDGTIGKCYGEVSERAYDANADIDDILSNPEEYNLSVDF